MDPAPVVSHYGCAGGPWTDQPGPAPTSARVLNIAMQQKERPPSCPSQRPCSVSMYMVQQAAAVLGIRQIDRASQLVVRGKVLQAKQALQILQ